MLAAQHLLVTGGAGFIGSHLVDRLVDEGCRVSVLDNESTGFEGNVNPAAEFFHGDVTNMNDLDVAFRDRPKAVLHVAGQASTLRSFLSPDQDLGINTQGTINLIQKCLEYQVPRMLYASTMVVYGHAKTIPIPETEPCEPVSYYGITKYAAERYVHATAKRKDLGFDFRVTSLRMFNVFGRRQSLTNPYQGVGAIFIGNILRNEPITIHSDGEQSRDFVHISDVVDAWVLALNCPGAYGEVFNLGTGLPTSINELADVTLEAMGRFPADYPIIHGPERAGDQRHTAADVRKARRILGWEPRVSFRDGMADTIAWALDQVPEARSGNKGR